VEEIQTWNPLSDSVLMGAWQRAFCYYLVKTMTTGMDHAQSFPVMVESLSHSTFSSFLPTEESWQSELALAGQQSLPLTYSWEETDHQLRITKIVVTNKGAKGEEPLNLNEMADPKLAHTGKMVQEMTALYATLTTLQARGHPSWQSVISLYRQAVYSWLHRGAPGEISAIVQRAEELKGQERQDHGHLVDYLNWFEVTHPYGRPQFRQFYDKAKEADEAHGEVPDPLQKYLSDFESRL
jgi:hypothetical protein